MVAEGIETREQLDILSETDCELMQGYYFSRPLPVAEFDQWWTAQVLAAARPME